jgi:uncharacterized protein (DUF934 family)
MPRLIKRGAVVDDPYMLVRGAALADVPEGVPVIVPLAIWLADRETLAARGEVGVWLAPLDDPEKLADDVGRLALIAVDFPSFTDGRGYSIARILRERYGYRGELRAVGDIQRDQLYYLFQVGFDAFAINENVDALSAVRGLRDFTDGYQLTQARTPWFRRRAESQGPPR